MIFHAPSLDLFQQVNIFLVSLKYCFKRLCTGQKKPKTRKPKTSNTKAEILVPLPPEIWMNFSCHVLLHNSWLEITIKCFAEILQIKKENMHCKIQFRALINTKYRKERPSGLLRGLLFTFSFLYCSFVFSLITLNTWVNIYVGNNTGYINCCKLLISGNYLFWNCLIHSLFIPMQNRLIWSEVYTVLVTWTVCRGWSLRRWKATLP